MRSSLILILILFVNYQTIAQSKTETEQWVKNKFTKWSIIDSRVSKSELNSQFITGGYQEKPISLMFNGCNTIFKTHYKSILSRYESNISYEFNYGDVKTVEWINYDNTDYLVIVTGKSLVKCKSIEKEEFSNGKNTGELDITYIDRCIIAFNTLGEDDFKNRMLKAFNHLKSFCSPSKIQKEVF